MSDSPFSADPGRSIADAPTETFGGIELRRVAESLWEIPATARDDMRVPARVVADREILEAVGSDRSLEQLQNVACLPGIVEAALAMPDMHQGYGFPVGGVAATAADGEGVVSPGGVGYDINCGVRLLAAPFSAEELGARRPGLADELARQVPSGTGRGGELTLRGRRLDRVLEGGPHALVHGHGIGSEDDLGRLESGGRLSEARPGAVSDRARERGADQLGTLGSGNHFVELQRVAEVLDARAAEAYGLREDQVTVLIHSGSRGLGHQVCTDFVKRMDEGLGRHGILLPDRQLSCAPIASREGRDYLAAMAAAANFAWANRHALAALVRSAIGRVIGAEQGQGTRLVYDVAHNVAKLEHHSGQRVCVHRKGATRAFAAGSEDVPAPYRDVGQPVFIPGSMGTSSFVLVGRPGAMELSFGTVCHGAGRRLSRNQARKQVRGADLRRDLEERGIAVRCASNRGLAEEAPLAYKEVDKVVALVERAGLADRVARLQPIGVVKG
jgi:tRNA-splicing ligase RtcB (3'-phosphate/5'-hydroxy nucleic acid ligase)